MKRLVFLKLGGSLITNKARPYTSRPAKMAYLADQIASARDQDPELALVLGHGSGSFGHAAAKHFGTRQGVRDSSQWRGFAEVWYQAARLNHLVIEALHQSGLCVVAFPPCSNVIAEDGKVHTWDITPLQAALTNDLLPVIYGDVVFDLQRGGTILSTEDLFEHLARMLIPKQILLAGREKGVWADYPKRRQLLKDITPKSISTQSPNLDSTQAPDVTGGMKSKVMQMLALVEEMHELDVSIFSGEESGAITQALRGERLGTTLHC